MAAGVFPRSTLLGGLLTLGVVIIWACELKLLEAIHHDALQLTTRTILACAALTLFVQGASVTWITSIPLTSASANSAIYQTSCPLAYVFSLPLLKDERLSLSKTLAVLLALCGVGAVIAAKRCGPDAVPNAVGGDLLVLASAALYALKEVLYKRWLGGAATDPPPQRASSAAARAATTEAEAAADSTATIAVETTTNASTSPKAAAASATAATPIMDAALTVSLIGVWCVLSSPVWLGILHASGVEPFELPPWHLARGYALVGGMMAAYQIMLFAAIALTSPTFVAVGQLLVSPISIAWDAIQLHYAMPPIALLGTVAIIGALCLVIGAQPLDAHAARVWRRRGGGMMMWRSPRRDVDRAQLVGHRASDSEAPRHAAAS